MKTIDLFLNKITMYRLVVYELVFLLLAAGMLGFFKVLPYNPLYLLFSTVFILCVCLVINQILASVFDAPINPESTWITALILVLILTPATSFFDPHFLPVAFWASAIAIASKYIFTIRKKHIFNPAAFGVAATALFLGLPASWWVGTFLMLPFVLIGGLLIVRKIHRFDLWWAFILVFTIGMIYFVIDHGLNLGLSLNQSFIETPLFFFATVMLTEPATTPPTRFLRILYGAGVAVLFLPNAGIGSFYFTPELALLVGNVFSYLVSPKQKLILRLKEKIHISRDIVEFIFTTNHHPFFRPGQYMEWTLAHQKADNRSVRRYFTIASSPTEKDLRLGIKFYDPSSSFKKALFSMRSGDTIVASQLAGDFTLPRNKNHKLVFIAGGIGVTPFRSMIKYLLDNDERRSITMFYANKTPADVVYQNLFDRAERELGIKTIYTFDSKMIDAQIIAREIPDYHSRTFYISGPQAMVASYTKMLTDMGIHRTSIRTDYFPGFA